ncbi:MAG TPA: hypothetical protein PLO69_14595 [Gammaproteobacteria bacterium]|nr:hypothetical protein [Gammaproteobacteria bacterium]
MSYKGTTAASTDRNPPINLLSVIGGGPKNTYAGVLSPTTAQSTAFYVGGAGLWYYRSSDSSTLVQTAGYFTDGLGLGMKTGDVMFCVHQTSYGTSPDLSVGVVVTTDSTAGFNMAIGGSIQSS